MSALFKEIFDSIADEVIDPPLFPLRGEVTGGPPPER